MPILSGLCPSRSLATKQPGNRAAGNHRLCHIATLRALSSTQSGAPSVQTDRSATAEFSALLGLASLGGRRNREIAMLARPRVYKCGGGMRLARDHSDFAAGTTAVRLNTEEIQMVSWRQG
jgi:hypothetical protein